MLIDGSNKGYGHCRRWPTPLALALKDSSSSVGKLLRVLTFGADCAISSSAGGDHLLIRVTLLGRGLTSSLLAGAGPSLRLNTLLGLVCLCVRIMPGVTISYHAFVVRQAVFLPFVAPVKAWPLLWTVWAILLPGAGSFSKIICNH